MVNSDKTPPDDTVVVGDESSRRLTRFELCRLCEIRALKELQGQFVGGKFCFSRPRSRKRFCGAKDTLLSDTAQKFRKELDSLVCVHRNIQTFDGNGVGREWKYTSGQMLGNMS
jgi:hypothetical protein